MPQKFRSYWIIPQTEVNEFSYGSFIEMLRYDSVRVEERCTMHALGEVFDYYVLSNQNGPRIERWKSFELPVMFVKRADRTPSFNQEIANALEAEALRRRKGDTVSGLQHP